LTLQVWGAAGAAVGLDGFRLIIATTTPTITSTTTTIPTYKTEFEVDVDVALELVETVDKVDETEEAVEVLVCNVVGGAVEDEVCVPAGCISAKLRTLNAVYNP